MNVNSPIKSEVMIRIIYFIPLFSTLLKKIKFFNPTDERGQGGGTDSIEN